MRLYVAGFAFHEDRVLLVEKLHPDWQAGKLNGIGGKVEPGEIALDAMIREFQEETGLRVDDWRLFCRLTFASGVVYFYTTQVDTSRGHQHVNDVGEVIAWFMINEHTYYRAIPNLRWLIPMARDKDYLVADVHETINEL